MSEIKRQKSRTDDEWFKLIMECRRSGLSDKAWCEDKGITLSTFYNAVTRLRKKACIPDREKKTPVIDLTTGHQDVVPIDIIQDAPVEVVQPIMQPTALQQAATANLDNLYTVEVTTGNTTIRLTNQTEPMMIEQIFRMLRVTSC